MRLLAALLLACWVQGQAPPAKTNPASSNPVETHQDEAGKPPVLENDGKPMTVPFRCTDDDMQWAGMSCTEDQPCPVYTELASLETVGNRIIVLANIHSESTTLYSVLLKSEDAGATWEEPYERVRGAALDHVQFIDFQNGWISGETLVPVSRDPFLLITSDGGKSWRLRPVFGDGGGGAIRQFHFQSASNGAMVIDRMESADSSRYELYETPNGGETWMIRRTSDKPMAIAEATPDAAAAGWRIRPDARSKAFVVEKRRGERWSPVASFLVEIGSCKPAPRVATPPPPEDETPPPTPDTSPSLKQPKRKK